MTSRDADGVHLAGDSHLRKLCRCNQGLQGAGGRARRGRPRLRGGGRSLGGGAQRCNVGKAVLGPTESRRGEPDSVRPHAKAPSGRAARRLHLGSHPAAPAALGLSGARRARPAEDRGLEFESGDRGAWRVPPPEALARKKLALSVATTVSLPFVPRRAAPWWSRSSLGLYRSPL